MDLPKRKPTRLRDCDYSADGYYFITICTKDRQNILSDIVGEGSPLPQLTIYGKIAEKYILNINKKYPNINAEKFVIMPNHIHIIFSVNNDGRGAGVRWTPLHSRSADRGGSRDFPSRFDSHPYKNKRHHQSVVPFWF